eukprot:2459488-Prymnesium_polylepis.2
MDRLMFGGESSIASCGDMLPFRERMCSSARSAAQTCCGVSSILRRPSCRMLAIIAMEMGRAESGNIGGGGGPGTPPLSSSWPSCRP